MLSGYEMCVVFKAPSIDECIGFVGYKQHESSVQMPGRLSKLHVACSSYFICIVPVEFPGTSSNKHALDRLKGILRPILHLKETEATVKEAVKEFIISSICSVTTLDQVLAQLGGLHKEEGLLSADLYKHAQDVAVKIYAESAEEVDEPLCKPEQSAVSARTEPLFCKDTVYHAGICSLAVSTCDAGNLLGLFKDREKVPGHSFREVSISRSKQDRYLVARQGESTFYFAFLSEPRLSEWAKQFKSFYEGT